MPGLGLALQVKRHPARNHRERKDDEAHEREDGDPENRTRHEGMIDEESIPPAREPEYRGRFIPGSERSVLMFCHLASQCAAVLRTGLARGVRGGSEYPAHSEYTMKRNGFICP